MNTGTESIFTPDGEKRVLNLEPSDPRKLHRFASIPPLEIPLSEVRDFDAWPSQVLCKDQNGAGACNGHAAATSVEFTMAMIGAPYVALSAWWVYGCLVMGRDRGSNIMDALELVESRGIAPESDVKYKDFSGRYSAQAIANALRYKVEIGRQLTTWEEIVTAVALRKGVNFSLRATNGWSGRLDADGCPPVGRGPGNHAVMVGGGIKTLSNGEKLVRMRNSWGVQWGDKGSCWLSRAHWEQGTWREAYEVVATVRDPQDTAPVAA